MTATACPTCGTRVDLLDARAGFARVCPRCLLAGVVKELGDALAPSKGVLTGRTLGNYEVLGLLGSGGMGAVYRAKQRGLDRQVALKVLATPGGEKEIERFFREARALARLRHPNIVAVHEVASDAGFYFYTMDLVAGYTLADEIARGPMPARRAAQLIATVARAVHHAHENGIIHRDLKPTNILLGEGGQPMVADFGLALDLQASQITRSGQPLGTAPYMAPEQAAGRHPEVDARTDVHALGAVLYECLAGCVPFRAESLWDVLRQVQFDEPAPLPSGVPADLAAVCLKAMAKRREDRYADAEGLARDLERYLDGRPVLAKRPSRARRLGRVAVSAAAILAACVAVAAALDWIGWSVLEQPRPPAVRPIDAVLVPFAPARTIDSGQGEVYDLAYSPDGTRLASAGLKGGVALWDARTGERVHALGHANSVYAIAFSPDGSSLVAGGWSGTLWVWDLRSRAARVLPEPSPGVWSVAFHPGGREFAAGSHDGIVRVWDARAGSVVRALRGPWRLPTALAYSPDGTRLAAAGPEGDSIVVFDGASGERVRTLERAHASGVHALAFATNDTLVSGGADGAVAFWNVATGAERGRNIGHRKAVEAVACHANGRHAATGAGDALASLWEIGREPGPHLGWLRGHAQEVGALAFRADGRWLASGASDGTIRLWALAAEDQPSLTPRDLVLQLVDDPEDRTVIDHNNAIVARLTVMGRDAVPALVEAARDRKRAGRGYAVYALCRVLALTAADDEQALEAVAACLADSSTYVRALAASGLELLKSRRLVEALLREFDPSRPNVVSAAQELTGVRFASRDEARAWWESHRSEFPPQVLPAQK